MAPGLKNSPYATMHYLMQPHVAFTASPVLAGVWHATPLTYRLTVMYRLLHMLLFSLL